MGIVESTLSKAEGLNPSYESYFLSIAAKMFRAEMSKISCSADLPPKSRERGGAFFFITLLQTRVENRGSKIANRSSILHLRSSMALRQLMVSSAPLALAAR
jgi:hypothetical protein